MGSQNGNGVSIRYTPEGELVLRYPGGLEDQTGIFPTASDRNIIETFVRSTAGRTLLMQQNTREIHCPLTGLLRREPGRQMISERLSRIGGVPFHGTVSVLVLDLDYCGRVNKQYGHTTGDHVLIWFANILKRWLRGSDVVVRWGGEEFVVFTSASQPPAERAGHRDRDLASSAFDQSGGVDPTWTAVVNNGEYVANRIVHNTQAGPCMVGGTAIHQGVTIGVASQIIIPGSSVEGIFERLFESADAQLRNAKTSDQRGKIHVAPMQT
ncbi:GGDEF domain-containing protein [Candidatus Uhrbacteria bacterium]|nr:GGDEF domain-containing protein [Candidatus Uhrbacteria bacterium]